MHYKNNNTNGISFKIEFFERTMKRTIPFENEWLRWENDMKVNLNRVEVKATLKLFHSFLVRDLNHTLNVYE